MPSGYEPDEIGLELFTFWPKVVGSNPTPATKLSRVLTGHMVYSLFRTHS